MAAVTQALLQARRAEAPRLNAVYAYLNDQVVDIYVPKRATAEYQQLVDQSRFNITQLLVSSLANNLFIDGYRPRRAADNAAIWDAVWQPNRMDARQGPLWRSAIGYGHSFVRVLPGQKAGKKTPVLTPFSARQATALYEDAINDEWPRYVMAVGTPRPSLVNGVTSLVVDVKVYDEHHEYTMTLPAGATATLAYGERSFVGFGAFSVNTDEAVVKAHDLGYTPFVRFLDSHADLDDAPQGVVWPMLPAQRQLNQTTFGLLMAQQYAAFRQRWVTGMAVEEDEKGNPVNPFNIAVDAMLQADDADTKFGEFGQTDLSGYLDSRDKTLLFVASARQIPPHTLVVGNAVSNVSAEALAALEAGHQQDIAEEKTSLGESAEQMFRLAGLAMDDTAAWEDTSAQVKWRDTTPRSLAQVADAYGKIATMLEVPAEELWEKIPDVTDQDLERWKVAKTKKDAEANSMAKLEGLMTSAQSRGQRANPPAPAGAGAGGVNGSRGRPANS